MNVLVVLGHQNPVDSFNRAIADTAIGALKAAGHEVVFHNLYEENFDPILTQDELDKGKDIDPTIQQHCDELMAADAYVIIHPNWWGQPPAILKGWVDRVIRQGLAYEFSAQGVVGHLGGKKAIVITTSNTPREIEHNLFGDPLENLWNNCTFGFCGVTDFYRRNFESVVLSTPEQRAEWLDEVERIMRERVK